MTLNKEDRKLRDKIIQKGRREITQKIKEGMYIEMMKEEYGIMDEKELISDKEFLDDMIRDIEKARKEKLEKELKESESDTGNGLNIVNEVLSVIKGNKFKIVKRCDKLESTCC